MKLKKRISALLLAATAVVASVCMTACGNDDAGDTNDIGDNDIGIKSEIMADAAAWRAAFDFSEVTRATFTLTMKTERGEEFDGVYKFDGDKVYEKGYSRDYDIIDGNYVYYTDNYEYYTLYSDEEYDDPDHPNHGTEYSYYLNEEGNWELSKDITIDRMYVEDITEDIFCSIYDDETGERVGFGERFSDFKYNDETGRYEATFSELGEIANVTVWLVFKGGKVYEGMLSGDSGGEVGEAIESKFTVTDIGTTTVTLPTVVEE